MCGIVGGAALGLIAAMVTATDEAVASSSLAPAPRATTASAGAAMLTTAASSSSNTAAAPHGASSSTLSTLLLLVACLILLGCCSVCVVAQLRRRRRHAEEEDRAPLLAPTHDLYGPGAGSGGTARGRGADMAAIGTPARDFVRLSSLPPSAMRVDEYGRRCMACNAENECVALRPCGHAVLCRACSDFVYTCPHCGGYISGIENRKDVRRGVEEEHPPASTSLGYLFTDG